MCRNGSSCESDNAASSSIVISRPVLPKLWRSRRGFQRGSGLLPRWPRIILRFASNRVHVTGGSLFVDSPHSQSAGFFSHPTLSGCSRAAGAVFSQAPAREVEWCAALTAASPSSLARISSPLRAGTRCTPPARGSRERATPPEEHIGRSGARNLALMPHTLITPESARVVWWAVPPLPPTPSRSPLAPSLP